VRALVLLAFTGCTWVYEAQYDDRREELEALRSEFLPASDQVQFLTAEGTKLYWVDLEKPLDTPTLHSYDPVADQRIDYRDISKSVSAFEENFRYGDAIFAECGSSTSTAWDAATSEEIQRISGTGVTSQCAVAGRDVYFIVGGSNRELFRWTPGSAGMSTSVMNLEDAGVGTASIGGFGVIGNRMLLAEGGRLWLVDLAARTATWLENADHPVTGLVVFDEVGVVFDSSKGVQYLRFDDRVVRSFDAMIADGGYRLNSQAADIHELADNGAYTLYGRHVVYRGRRGIFAFDLERNKVTDLLLDNGKGFDAETVYRGASVTSDGTLFVQHRNNFGSEPRPVYRVDLSARLP
jgi:hypothetical protein